ncbi:MAG: sugar nucleotide-binding protein, partial [Gammaproteobacteria bacterium]|nr:sugar nucleotide-binding protein [Gammaproteobacteria bacterium]
PTHAKRPANSRLKTERLTTEFGIKADDWQCQLDNVIAALVVNEN